MISPIEDGIVVSGTDANPVGHQVERVAHDRLGQCGYGPLRSVACEYRDGVLTLNGSVPTFYLKQVAQAALKDLQHVRQIDNRLVVAPTQ